MTLACLAFTFLFSIWVTSVAAALQSEPNAEPIKSTLTSGSSGVAHHVPPNGGWCDHPWVGIIVLIFAPYIDRNPSNKPEDRKFATSLMTVHLMFWAVLVMIGSSRSWLQLHFLGVTDCSWLWVEMAQQSSSSVIVLVVLAGASFATLARSDVRAQEPQRRNRCPHNAPVKQQGRSSSTVGREVEAEAAAVRAVPTSCRLKTSPQAIRSC